MAAILTESSANSMCNLPIAIPLSLYVHIPWCVRKCPYCDFNSHQAKGIIPESAYVTMLLTEFEHYLTYIHDRPLVSIFFGGGTPSLFSDTAIKAILDGIRDIMPLAPDVEITLEANPGTVDEKHFEGYLKAGVNRLSLGIQSLNSAKLKSLGRIHDRKAAIKAVKTAKTAGFTNFNVDIMYGLPEQSVSEAIADVEKALALTPTHFSWYQLTIEPNTAFHHSTPQLPEEEQIWEMQCEGQALLKKYGFKQYEVSAYAKDNKACKHNLNYWEFGDYLGIGAGGHSKLTNLSNYEVHRFLQAKHPRHYLDKRKRVPKPKFIQDQDLIFEFMLNALRLTEGVSLNLFAERTGLSPDLLAITLQEAVTKGLLQHDPERLQTTERGKRFLNDLVAMFLPY